MEDELWAELMRNRQRLELCLKTEDFTGAEEYLIRNAEIYDELGLLGFWL